MQTLELNEKNIITLANSLERSLNLDATVRRQAENEIISLKRRPGFGLLVLKLIQLDSFPLHTRQAGATLFKNYVKSCWEDNTIDASEKKQIRDLLPPFMLSVPKSLQKLISASLKQISDIDFPENWPELLPNLVQQLQSTNSYAVINGIMKVLDSIFKRFRFQFGTDAVLSQIKYVLSNFAIPLLEVFKLTCVQIDTNAKDPNALTVLFTSLKVICNIFYSLSAVDLPAVFEDNLPTWMPGLLKFIVYQTDLECLIDADHKDTPGLLHKVQSSIIATANLYIEKYEEEFRLYLPDYVTAVWNLLMKTPNKPKYDTLVTSSILFLTTVSRSTCFELFKDPQVLEDICKNIVVPNIKLRKSDIYLFKDDPLAYVRKDFEGSDHGTRRSSAYELVKGLRKNFEAQVTQIFAIHINQMLAEYNTNPSRNWSSKDAAIYLLTALTVNRASASEGVTSFNQAVPIREFYTSQILPELTVDTSPHLVLKASCLNFINTFRRQFTIEDFSILLTIFINHLGALNFVVRSYAAICVDNFLIVRDKTDTGYVLRFDKSLIQLSLPLLVTNIFTSLGVSTTVENHYLIKALRRVFNMAGADILPMAEPSLIALTTKLEQIYKSPSNPEFGYYLFDSLAGLIRTLCKRDIKAVDTIEAILFPTFNKIVCDPSADVYSPFVFQLMSLLLETRKAKLPKSYEPLLREFTAPIFWEQQGNVPALTRLLQAYVDCGPEFIVQSKLLSNILGVFQKLISSKITDYLGFYLLQSIIEHIPSNDFAFALPDIFKVIFVRIQGSKTTQLVKSFIVFLSFFIGQHGPILVIDSMTKIQKGIFLMVLQSLWTPHVESVKGKLERKACSIAITKLLCDWPEILSSEYIEYWPTLLRQAIHLCEGLEAESVVTQEDLFNEEEERGGHYSSGFTTLQNATKVEVDFFADVNPKALLARSIKRLSETFPGKIASLVISAGPQYSQAVEKYFVENNISAIY